MPNTPSPPLHPLVIQLDDILSEFYEGSTNPTREVSEKLAALQLLISARLFALESAQQVFAALGTE